MLPIPYRDENQTDRTPVITILIIVANVAVWIWQVLQPPYPIGGTGSALPGVDGTTLDYGAVPYFILHGLHEGQVHLGRAVLTLHQEVPQPWMTIFTSMFMHGSWMHIIGNMWFLWIFGDNVEDSMGRVRFVFFYLICGVAAAGAQILAAPNSTAPMVGASGAIAGVLGGYLLLFPHARIRSILFLFFIILPLRVPAWILLGLWFVSQFLLPLNSGVAWMAHVGGFLAGLGLVRLFVKSRPVRPRRVAPGVYDVN